MNNHRLKYFEGKKRSLFIRFKDIPNDEISGIYDGDNGRIGSEIGVSCFEFTKQGKCFKIILSSLSTGFLYDLIGFLSDFESGTITAYLIEAEKVGIGNYGEPVVKHIKIIKQLKYAELAENKPVYKMDRTNIQLI